ncbi:MAG: MFS transporter [Sutterella sp.]|nr:MFS transporter [Sutterella sp.]
MQKSLAAALVIIAVTLQMRGPVTCVGPLAERLTAEMSLSAALYGLVAALPIAAFGLVSFAAPGSARRFGLCGAVSVFLISLAAGGFIRSLPNYPSLLLGTVFIGAGIASLNVLMPVVIKDRFPQNAGRMMGIYTGVIGLSGSVGALVSAPLAGLSGFTQTAFLLWALYGTAVIILWKRFTDAGQNRRETMQRAPGLWRRPAAWAVTAVMGLQSLLIYTVVAWLPPYLLTQGTSSSLGGAAVALYLLSGLPASILTARFMKFCGPEWVSEFLMSFSYLAGLWCWTQGGWWIALGSILAGAPQGSMLTAAFILVAEKTRSSAEMLGLSAMTQGFGYLGAGTGPLIFAACLGDAENWTSALLFVAFVILLWAGAGFAASRFESVFPADKHARHIR